MSRSPVPLRPPEQVMRLDRMGASFPTRLSFSRSLIRLLAAEGVEVARVRWDLDDDGFGTAVYGLDLGGHRYSLVAFSTPLDAEQRTDRVIAEAWDSSYTLYDGEPDEAELQRLAAAVPRQDRARYTARELTLARANRSVRLFEHVVERLAVGRQPDRDLLRSTGYLMRTTAVYGNGKFGIADRARFADRPGLGDPFRAEFLTVWLIRAFTIDLVEHIAARRDPNRAVALDPDLARGLGVGNATGLGMAPFLVTHPILIHRWTTAKETALARIRSVTRSDDRTTARLRTLVDRARRHVAEWRVEDERQQARIDDLGRELDALADRFNDDGALAVERPWDRLVVDSEAWSLEGQELTVALLIEAHPHLVDELTDTMATDEQPALDPTATVAELRDLATDHFDWLDAIDFDRPEATARFWYYSEDRLEPRLGVRHEEDGADFEEPLDVALRVARLREALVEAPDDELLAQFLLRHPEHRYAAVRVATVAAHPYAEIRANLIGAGCLPIDMLRWKLAFFGAAKFDPKSDLWTRITLFQGAPLPSGIAAPDADDWWLPVLPDAGLDPVADPEPATTTGRP